MLHKGGEACEHACAQTCVHARFPFPVQTPLRAKPFIIPDICSAQHELTWFFSAGKNVENLSRIVFDTQWFARRFILFLFVGASRVWTRGRSRGCCGGDPTFLLLDKKIAKWRPSMRTQTSVYHWYI